MAGPESETESWSPALTSDFANEIFIASCPAFRPLGRSARTVAQSVGRRCLSTSERFVELILAAHRQMYAILSEFGTDVPIHCVECAMCPRRTYSSFPGASLHQLVANKRGRIALICLLITGRAFCAIDRYTVEHGNLVTVCLT